jgi:hypothetical protein
MRRLSWRDAWLVVPALALTAWLDWHGLKSWFQQDDFAWLSLGGRIHSFHDLLDALFRPAAQGTVRVFSERASFLLLERWFGLDHRPFHLLGLATHALNLALLAWITLRLSGSRLAAAAAPIVWAAGLGLAVPLAWISAYNEILCAFCLLAAFVCLLEWLESGKPLWLAAQWAFFAAGFGVLEIVVVYPALAAAWCWIDKRRVPRAVWWMWLASALFAAAHLWLIPKPADGPYARHWDPSMAATLLQYASMALGGNLEPLHWPLPRAAPSIIAALTGAAAALWLALAWRRGEKLALFGAAWFALAIAPVLPLRDHVSDYYLAIPSIGWAWVAATALAAASRGAWWARLAAVAVLGWHLAYVGAAHRITADFRYRRGLDARHLFFALDTAVQRHPGKLIVVSGLGEELFWAAFFDSRMLLAARICLDPRDQSSQWMAAGPAFALEARCAPAEIAQAARDRRLAAYRWVPRKLHAWTRHYRHRLPREWLAAPPTRIDAADPNAAPWLGSGWYQIEPGGRWTSLRAEATLAAPDTPGRALAIFAYRPLEPEKPPARLTVRLNGVEALRFVLPREKPAFAATVPLPPLAGSPQLRVELEVDRPFPAPGDARRLGIVVSRLEWQ